MLPPHGRLVCPSLRPPSHFALRIVDVSLGTVRMIVMVRGYRGMAALTGFLEVIISIVAIGSALDNLGSIYHVVGYAGGFAAGSYVGVVVEEYLALGQVVVRAIIPDESDGRTARRLREEGYAVTELDGRGRDGPIDVLNTVDRTPFHPLDATARSGKETIILRIILG